METILATLHNTKYLWQDEKQLRLFNLTPSNTSEDLKSKLNILSKQLLRIPTGCIGPLLRVHNTHTRWRLYTSKYSIGQPFLSMAFFYIHVLRVYFPPLLEELLAHVLYLVHVLWYYMYCILQTLLAIVLRVGQARVLPANHSQCACIQAMYSIQDGKSATDGC